MAKKTRARRTKGPCFNCKAACAPSEWCYGCKSYVCFNCMEPQALAGLFIHSAQKHKPTDHLYRIVRFPWGATGLPTSALKRGFKVITDEDMEDL